MGGNYRDHVPSPQIPDSSIEADDYHNSYDNMSHGGAQRPMQYAPLGPPTTNVNVPNPTLTLPPVHAFKKPPTTVVLVPYSGRLPPLHACSGPPATIVPVSHPKNILPPLYSCGRISLPGKYTLHSDLDQTTPAGSTRRTVFLRDATQFDLPECGPPKQSSCPIATLQVSSVTAQDV